MNFRGIVFDVDGTLVDSNDAHARAFVDTFRSFGYDIAFEKVRPLIGTGSDKLIPELIGRYEEGVAGRKKMIFMERYLPTVRAFPRVEPLLQKLKAKGFKLAVASSAAKDELDALLALRSTAQARIAARPLRHGRGHAVRCGRGARRGRCVHGLRCGGWGDRDLQPAVGVFRDPGDLLANIDSWTRSNRDRHAV